ncbi:hypothetical protein SAMN06272789_4481 [Streptomyces sp. 1331.2]|nr:hypothetical protein SAMN06272789_4481 [Streptomyces sp. 1331.2]
MNHRTTTEAPADPAGVLGPSPYGLTPRETRAELRRLSAAGWQLWELRLRFTKRRTTEKEVTAW